MSCGERTVFILFNLYLLIDFGLQVLMSNICQWLLSSLIVIRIILCYPINGPSKYVLKETHPVSEGWCREGPAQSQHVVNLQIGLKSRGSEMLERHLYEGTPH